MQNRPGIAHVSRKERPEDDQEKCIFSESLYLFKFNIFLVILQLSLGHHQCKTDQVSPM